MTTATAAATRRLKLVEGLLDAPSPRDCAWLAVRWLSACSEFERVLCLGASPDHGRLVYLASHGLPGPVVAEFAIDLASGDDPLARALAEGRPVRLAPARCGPHSPRSTTLFGHAPLVVVGMHGVSGDTQTCTGALLARASTSRATRDLSWVAARLGAALARLDTAARLERERDALRADVATLQAVRDALTQAADAEA